MRIGAGLGLVICCCAGLVACNTAAPKGPDVTVTAPSVGRPPAPDSAQTALSREAFTPYAGLGASTDDGLAPGETYSALGAACMNDAGYGQLRSQHAVPGPDKPGPGVRAGVRAVGLHRDHAGGSVRLQRGHAGLRRRHPG